MNMFGLSNSALIAIYVGGVFLLPILFGIWQRDRKITLGDDILPFFFIAVLWPAGVALIVFFGAICLALVVPVWVFRLLTSLGVKMGNWIETARRRKKYN